MAVIIRTGKHFGELSKKYSKTARIKKLSSGSFELAFIPDFELGIQLNHIRNSGQVHSEDWRGIEHGLVTMLAVGVLPVDELITAIKLDMEELGYAVEVIDAPAKVAINDLPPIGQTTPTRYDNI